MYVNLPDNNRDSLPLNESGRNPDGRKKAASNWNLDRVFSLLKENVEAITREHPDFYGTLKIEVTYRNGEIETVAVDRRQTFKHSPAEPA